MAKKQVSVKNCDRHMGVVTEGVQTVRFGVAGDTYEVDLCPTHQLQFDREISAWTRIAREVVASRRIPNGRFDVTREREMAQAVRPGPVSSFLPTEPDPNDKKVYVQKLPPGFNLWSLTEHAQQRLAERGVTERDVLIAAADPGYAFRSEQDPGEWFHIRNNIVLVVNREKHVVITVMPRDWQDQTKEKVHG